MDETFDHKSSKSKRAVAKPILAGTLSFLWHTTEVCYFSLKSFSGDWTDNEGKCKTEHLNVKCQSDKEKYCVVITSKATAGPGSAVASPLF